MPIQTPICDFGLNAIDFSLKFIALRPKSHIGVFKSAMLEYINYVLRFGK